MWCVCCVVVGLLVCGRYVLCWCEMWCWLVCIILVEVVVLENFECFG